MGEIDEGVMEGYLLLADISGYTTFLTGTELEHSHAIVTELTKLIRATLSPPMHFVKLEGDAVFCFAPQAAFPSGELLVELVESCYFDFTNRLLNMTRSTTCTCDACRAISGLDLKFVVHNGTFIVDRDEDGRLDLAGPNVILVHQLLKNTIIEQGGPSSYGFFTDPCLTGVSPEFRLPVHEESIESFRPVTGVVQDLAAVTAQRREAQVVRLTDDDADFVSSYIVDAPPAVCWQYFVEPGKRLRHTAGAETGIEFTPNREGRVATGASSHCAHGAGGDGLREYLDWRPHEYFTCHLSPVEAEGVEPTIVEGLETYEFIDLGDGRTEHRWLLRADDRSPEGIRAFEESFALLKEFATDPSWGDQMRRPIAEDAAMYGLDRPVG
ncbi:MAG: DUF2652 domain-containing protein [Actinomycetota bacterium]|nr:DUF2652 domain-containing protein [Actinomycetota bacterium]